MSDEIIPHQDGLPSAEDLDAVAHEQEIAEATVNSVNDSKSICASCSNPSTRICSHCGQEFCANHYCVIHELQAESSPLTDTDGTTHQGRRIRLIGEGWPNDLRMIKDTPDEELENQIRGLQELLQNAIRTADYAQISIAARDFELGYRKHSRYVAAMKRREKLQQGTIRLNSKKHRVEAGGKQIPTDIAALMKLGNLTYDQAVAMKSLLQASKKT